MEQSSGDTTKADYWVDTRYTARGDRTATERQRGGERERDGTLVYNQDSRTQNCRLGGNSGLASETVLNFPKMDETRPGDKKENERPKSVSHLDRCGCCSSSFVPPPDLTQVCLYLKVSGGRQSTTALPKPTSYLGLESTSLVSLSSVTTRCGTRGAIGYLC
jgi:hypothetical protein